jgi:hypothetical protein
MFKRIPSLLPPKLWWIGFLSFLFMASAFYLILSRGHVETLVIEHLEREKVLSRATARNLEIFFDVVGNSTAFRAQLNNKEHWDAETQEDMDTFINQWRDSGFIAGVILADEEGTVKLNSNVMGTNDVGTSVADRDYFIWAKGESKLGQYMVGQPVISRLGASKGELIIPVAAPVFRDGNFVGVLSTATRLRPLTQRFLEMMKVTDKTSVYLFDSQKQLLYASPDSPDLNNEFIASLDISNDKFRHNKDLIAISRVNLGDQQWFVIISSPYKEVFGQAIPFYIRQAAVLIVMSLITLGFGIIVSRESQNKL